MSLLTYDKDNAGSLEFIRQRLNLTFSHERDTLDQQYRREREHLTTERDNKVARIRRGEG